MIDGDTKRLIHRAAVSNGFGGAIAAAILIALVAWVFSTSLWWIVKWSLILGGVGFAIGYLSKASELDEVAESEKIRQSVKSHSQD